MLLESAVSSTGHDAPHQRYKRSLQTACCKNEKPWTRKFLGFGHESSRRRREALKQRMDGDLSWIGFRGVPP